MSQKKKVLFIINPIAGGKNKDHVPGLIKKHLKNLEYEVIITQRPHQATELAEKAAADGVDVVVAVGGDGTVNEVVKGILHTKAVLSIVPFGSGNGLARHLGIPMDVAKSIDFINNAASQSIDVCTLNGEPFANMAGTGFDALIGKLFAEQKGRGFSTYISTTLREFANYKPRKYTLYFDDETQKVEEEAFLISFANSTQYGNNAHIAPKADIRDGKLDICIMKEFPLYAMPGISIRLFAKSLDKSKYLRYYKASKVVVEREESAAVHLDGEPFVMGQRLELEVLPLSLNVLLKNV